MLPTTPVSFYPIPIIPRKFALVLQKSCCRFEGRNVSSVVLKPRLTQAFIAQYQPEIVAVDKTGELPF